MLLSLGSAPLVVDLAEDVARSAPRDHLTVQALMLLPWTLALALAAVKAVAFRNRALQLRRDLDATNRDLDRARADARMLSLGIADSIASQLDRWRLTPAEKEVAQLLLKGLGHREIARLRHTSEKTVRQQAASVYQKADLGGRAELSAFFLEDLLVLPAG